MAFQTEVFQGDFQLKHDDVDSLTQALEKLLAVADKVTGSLKGINVKVPKVDTSPIDKVGEAAEKAAEKVNKTLAKALSLQDVKKQTGLDDITAIITGQFSQVPDKTQPVVVKLREQFADLKRQIGDTFDGKNIDLAKVDALKTKFGELSTEVRKITEMQSGDTIDEAIKKINILSNQSRVANENIGAGLGRIATGLGSLSQVNSFGSLLDSLTQIRNGALTVGQSFSNVRAGIELATRDGGNLFLGVRQAIFGVSSSSNVAARALDFLAATFTKSSQESDRLLASARGITSQIAQFNNDMALAATALKQVAKEENLNLNALNKLDAQIIDVAKQYTRLNDVIAGGGKITPTQLSQVQNKSDQLLKTIENLINSGFVPLDSVTGKTLLGMRDKFQDNVQAGKVLEAQVKAIEAAQEKEAQTVSKSQKAYQAVGSTATSIFSKVKAAVSGAFQSAPADIDRTRSSVQQLNTQLQQTSFKSNLIAETLGTVFGNVIYGLISKATGAVSNFVGLFTQGFVKSNNLVQNFNITLRQMMAGLDSGQIDSAIGNITDFIKEKVAKSPFELADAFQSFQRLATAGLDPKKWLTPVADAAAAVNKPMEQLIGAMQRLQAGSKGIGIDMLRDFGIPVNQVGSYIDKVTGQTLTLDEVFKKNGDITKLSAGELANLGIEFKKLEFDKQGALVNSTSEALDILNGYLQQNTTFAGAAESRSRSLTGVLSNFRDVITNLTVLTGQPIFEKLTTAGQGLLNAIGILQPQLNRLATVIGTGIAGMFDFLGGKIGDTDSLLRSLAAGINQFTNFVSAIFAGDWTTAWGMFTNAAYNGVSSVFNILDGLAGQGIEWGFSFVEQIADGILDAASSILTEAVTYISETIASFLQPGSPPKEGPLSTIDKWGRGITDVWMEGTSDINTAPLRHALGRVRDVFNAFDLGTAQNDVLSIQEQINKAEADGFVPADLKKQLQLAQDKVALIQQQQQLQEQLNQAKEDESKAETRQKKQKQDGGKVEGAGGKDRVGVEKKTAEQVRTDALAILDQQLKDGVIKYEDYAKERLKIEEKFYEDTAKEGGKVTAQNIKDIKFYQDEVARIAEENKKKKSDAAEGSPISIPSGRDILAGFSDLPDKIGKVGEQSAYALSERMSKTIYKGIDDIKLNVISRLTTLGQTIKTKLASVFTPTAQKPLVAFTGGDAEVSTFSNLLTTLQPVIEYIKANLPIVQATFLTVWEIIKSSTTAAFDAFKSSYETNLKPAIDQLGLALGGLGITWPQVFEALKSSAGIVFSAIGAIILGAVAVVVGLVTAIVTGVSYMISGFQTLGSGIGQVITGIIQVLTSIMFFVTNIFQGNFTTAFSGIGTFFQGIYNIAAGLVNSIIGLFTILVGTVYGIVSGFIKGIIGFFTNLYNDLVGHSIVVDIVEGIIGLLESLVIRGTAAVRGAVIEWVNAFGEAVKKFYDIGRDVISGIIKGINENKGKVLEVLKAMIADAVGSVTSYLGIQSPSLLFADIGANMIEGLNQGLASVQPNITSIVNAAADDVEKFLDKEGLGGDKVGAALKAFKTAFKDNFDDIIKLGVNAGGELLNKLSGAMGAAGIEGGVQGQLIKRAAEQFVRLAKEQQAAQPLEFARQQQKVLDGISKSTADILTKFNQQVFNIRSSSTEARIELEKLFNRTVTDEEVEKMAKAFEGTPVDQLNAQQKLIYRNYLLQQKLTGATAEEVAVRETIASLGTATSTAQDLIASVLPPQAPQQAQATGNALLQSLGLGMDAGTSDVLARLATISTTIIDQLRSTFGIASPSTVMMGFGENLTEGLANGITGSLSHVTGAMDLVSAAINPTARLNVGGLGGMNLDLATMGAGAGGGLQLIQYNTIGDEFDMAVFTARTQAAIDQLLRTGR